MHVASQMIAALCLSNGQAKGCVGFPRGFNKLHCANGLARPLRNRSCALAPPGHETRVSTGEFSMRYSNPITRRCLMATAGVAMGLAAVLPAQAQDTIKVGILHS